MPLQHLVSSLDGDSSHSLSVVLDQVADARTLLRAEAACRVLRMMGRDAFSHRSDGRWHRLCCEVHPETATLRGVTDYRLLHARFSTRKPPAHTNLTAADLQLSVKVEVLKPYDVRTAEGFAEPDPELEAPAAAWRTLAREAVAAATPASTLTATFDGSDAQVCWEEAYWLGEFHEPGPVGFCWPAPQLGLDARIQSCAYSFDQQSPTVPGYGHTDSERFGYWLGKAQMPRVSVSAFRASDQKVLPLLKNEPLMLTYGDPANPDSDYHRFGDVRSRTLHSNTGERIAPRDNALDLPAKVRDTTFEGHMAMSEILPELPQRISPQVVLAPPDTIQKPDGSMNTAWELHLHLLYPVAHDEGSGASLTPTDMLTVLDMAAWR